MQKQPELIGLEAMTGRAIRFQVEFVILPTLSRCSERKNRSGSKVTLYL